MMLPGESDGNSASIFDLSDVGPLISSDCLEDCSVVAPNNFLDRDDVATFFETLLEWDMTEADVILFSAVVIADSEKKTGEAGNNGKENAEAVEDSEAKDGGDIAEEEREGDEGEGKTRGRGRGRGRGCKNRKEQKSA